MKAGVKHPLPAIMFDLGRTFLTAVERRPDAMSVADELQLLSYAGWYAEIARVGWSAMPSRRSAWASNMAPPSEVMRPPIERGGDLLALHGWKRERQQAIVDHGGCGSLVCRNGMAFDTQFLRHLKRLRYTHKSSITAPCIRWANPPHARRGARRLADVA